MSSLQGYVDRRVLLILQDGRAIVVSHLAIARHLCIISSPGRAGWL